MVACDLFEKILFASNVQAMAWDFYCPLVMAEFDFETQALENAVDDRVVDG